MATHVFECKVCNEEYNSSNRKPLFLQCGHTFCSKCLVNVETTCNKSCPSCRWVIQQTFDTLPVNYALVPSPKHVSETRHLVSADLCESHGCALDYICVDCREIVCRKCSKQFHGQHNVEFKDDVVERDEISTKFITDLKAKIQTKVDGLTESLSLFDEIFQSVNTARVDEEGLKEFKDSFASLKTSTTQDLETWQDSAPKSLEERKSLFKKLCEYWTLNEKILPVQEMSRLLNKLRELGKAAREIQTVTERLESHLQQDVRGARTSYSESYPSPISRVNAKYGPHNQRNQYQWKHEC